MDGVCGGRDGWVDGWMIGVCGRRDDESVCGWMSVWKEG